MYKQEREILDQIRSFHKRLSEFYSSLKDKAENQKAIMLLDYLSRHEKLREEFIIRYKEVAPEPLMQSWLQLPDEHLSKKICKCFESIEYKSKYTIEDIVEIAMHLDDCLIKVYEALAVEEESNSKVSNIFYALMKKTKQQEMNLARDLNWLYDM